MITDLYIIGAGDVGGFIYRHYLDMGKYNLKGFLDNDPSKIGCKIENVPILGNEEILENIINPCSVVIAIANPQIRKKIYNKIKDHPLLYFPSFIHPNSWIGKGTVIGKGCIVYPGVSINYNSVLKDFTIINMNSVLGHDCNLEEFTTLSPGVSLGGNSSIGSGSFLGINSTMIQGLSTGHNAIIGAGTVVIKDVPDGCTVVGNPGRIIRKK